MGFQSPIITRAIAEGEQQQRWGCITHRRAVRCRCGHLSFKRTPDNALCLECAMLKARTQEQQRAAFVSDSARIKKWAQALHLLHMHCGERIAVALDVITAVHEARDYLGIRRDQ